MLQTVLGLILRQSSYNIYLKKFFFVSAFYFFHYVYNSIHDWVLTPWFIDRIKEECWGVRLASQPIEKIANDGSVKKQASENGLKLGKKSARKRKSDYGEHKFGESELVVYHSGGYNGFKQT